MTYSTAEIERHLTTTYLGHPLLWFDQVASTSDEARRHAETGAPQGLVVVAEQQTAGRGRLGRAWTSPPGGIWMSVLLRSQSPPTGVLALRCALAVCAAIQAVTGRSVRVKWPNDVLVLPERLKVAGILLESKLTGQESYVIVGIGINAAVDPGRLDPALRSIATGLGEADIRAVLLAKVLEQLEGSLALPDPVAVVRPLCDTLGRTVRVEWESGQVEGQATDLDADGGLVVTAKSGQRQTVWSCLRLTEI